MVSQLLLGVLNFLPGLLVMYFVVGAYEDHFEHQAMFLAVMAGLVLGLLLWIGEAFVLADGAILFIVPAFTLMETMAKTMFVGLPRFRDERQTVLLGGAMGVLLAPMILMLYTRPFMAQPFDVWLLVRVISVTVGYTLVHFVTGLIVGQGPANGSVLGTFLPSAGWLLPAHVLLGLMSVRAVGDGLSLNWMQGDLVWGIVLAAYGVALMLWRGPGLIVDALPRSERAAWRREQMERGN